MIIITILLFIITIISVSIAIYCANNKIKLDTDTKKINEEIQNKNRKLQRECQNLQDNYKVLQNDNTILINSITQEKQQLEDIRYAVKTSLENQTEMSQKAFENYWQVLENKYKETEKEYDELNSNLKTSYSNLQFELIREAEEIQNELDKIRATRASAIEAQRKEKEIKEKLSFYCLTPTNNELDDVKKLNRIKPDLHNPRILSMLIWSTYFQKPMTALCNNILGTSTIIGIYKITNQKNNMCYIGQSVDVATRWKQHAKCGLGIDTPSANKLYKAMMEEGIWNFSWELLEQCSREELDKKEKFYINLYQSYEYGYNSNTGIGGK